MRRIALLLGVLLITGLITHDIYEFFVTNEGIRYYSSEPQRLLPVVLLGLGGGFIALWISRLTSSSQRTLKLLALGGFAIICVGLAVFIGYMLYSLSAAPIVNDGVGSAWLWAGSASALIAAGILSWEFSQVWRKTP